MADTHTSIGSGAWTAAGTWDKGAKPADGDTVVIAAGHAVEFDEDMTGWTGIAGLTITSHATTPGMLYAKHSGAGTYYLKVKDGSTIAGTNAAAKGRLLANSNGTWGGTGSLPNDRQFTIDLGTTASIVALYLDIALYCTQPTNGFVTVYGTKLAVNSVNTGTDVLTCASSHGWSAGRPVMVRSSGTLPAPLAANTVYYVTSPSGADLKLAAYSGGAALDITSSGSGTIEVYDGHQSTSTGTVNVLEDVTGDAPWSTTAGRNAVVLVDAAAPEDYDQQRLTLSTINAGSLVLSANVDSVQFPGARVWLASRNVRVISATTNSSLNLLDYTSASHGGVFQCEIRSTAGTGTTFYGRGVIYGSGHTVSGSVSGCYSGTYYGTGHTVSGSVSGCTNGTAYGSGHTVSGSVSGCSNGVIYGTGHTVSGSVSGCYNGIYFGSGQTVSGSVSGCSYGVAYGSGVLKAAVLSGNGQDLYNAIVSGFGTLASTSQNGAYKHVTVPMVECRFTAMVSPLAGVAGSHGCWTQGGYSKSATYAQGTHGTPPVTPPNNLIHVLTAQDSDRVCYVEIPLRGLAGRPILATLYGKLTGTSAWTTRPTIGIYDPAQVWQSVPEALAVSAQMAANTDWQTLTAFYVPAADMDLMLRVQCVGGNADGSGNEQLYWMYTLAQGAAPQVIGSPIIKGGRSW